MIYLIGGAPRCGKSILAKKISSRKKIGWLSTDRLWTVVFNSTPKSQLKKKFPGFFLFKKAGSYAFEIHSPKTLWQNELIESESIWPGVRGLIKALVAYNQDFIIEGVHLLPKLVNQLKKTACWKDIGVVYLVKTDLAKIKEGIPKNKKDKLDWLLAGGIDLPGRLDKASAMIQYESRCIEKEARKYKFMVVNTEKDFNKKMNKKWF
ncbi:MAG: hypothetical protein NTZ49_03725 [Candidatus Parcubacteria bacterium]|nr:hypothetical protein [Candidatus Parcubacteria bacterium]